jgi:hypothetical protein
VAITTKAGGEEDTTTTIPMEYCRERYRDGKEEEWLGVGDRGGPGRFKSGIEDESKSEVGTGVANAVAVYISPKPGVGNIGGVGRCGDKGGPDLDTEPSGNNGSKGQRLGFGITTSTSDTVGGTRSKDSTAGIRTQTLGGDGSGDIEERNGEVNIGTGRMQMSEVLGSLERDVRRGYVALGMQTYWRDPVESPAGLRGEQRLRGMQEREMEPEKMKACQELLKE